MYNLLFATTRNKWALKKFEKYLNKRIVHGGLVRYFRNLIVWEGSPHFKTNIRATVFRISELLAQHTDLLSYEFLAPSDVERVVNYDEKQYPFHSALIQLMYDLTVAQSSFYYDKEIEDLGNGRSMESYKILPEAYDANNNQALVIIRMIDNSLYGHKGFLLRGTTDFILTRLVNASSSEYYITADKLLNCILVNKAEFEANTVSSFSGGWISFMESLEEILLNSPEYIYYRAEKILGKTSRSLPVDWLIEILNLMSLDRSR